MQLTSSSTRWIDLSTSRIGIEHFASRARRTLRGVSKAAADNGDGPSAADATTEVLPDVAETPPPTRKKRTTRKKTVASETTAVSLDDAFLPSAAAPLAHNDITRAAQLAASASPALTIDDLTHAAPTHFFEAKCPGSLPRLWVVFSDLHVSDKSIDVCIKVLKRVHSEAKKRDAGIIFLGDFWDARGDLPVEPLNSVLQEFKKWQRPVLMLVGNHDQVNLGGDSHALTPLAAASEWVHVFDVPTLYLDALWLPYRRDGAVLQGAIKVACEPATSSSSSSSSTTTTSAAAPARSPPCANSMVSSPSSTISVETSVNDGSVLADAAEQGARDAYGISEGGQFAAESTASPSGAEASGLAAEATGLRRSGAPSAIFCHADVVSAKQNSGRVAQDGVLPGVFPVGMPVYTGHYHMPQTLPGTAITYVGSPYQVTMGEAHEAKRLMVLDSHAGWCVAEEVPIQVGRQHYRTRGTSLKQALAEQGLMDQLQRGDRIKWSAPSMADFTKDMEQECKELSERGIQVQVVPEAPARQARIQVAENLSVEALLERYAQARPISTEALALAHQALQAVQQQRGATATGPGSKPPVSVVFQRVELEGYGPFRHTQVYELDRRGVRIVTGANEDEAAADSNGSGKSCLVAAPWWALTGRLLARTESGSVGGRDPVGAMLNDDSRQGRVTLTGLVNGEPFEVERVVECTKTRKTVKTRAVTFKLGGRDLTQQEVRMTQALIDDTFNTDLLQQAAFYGQNDITALLEAGDKEVKQLLAKVVEMEVWEEAREGFLKAERLKSRTVADQLQGRLSTLQQLVQQRELELPDLEARQAAWQAKWTSSMHELAEGEAAQLLSFRGHAETASDSRAVLQRDAARVAASAAEVQQALEQLSRPDPHTPVPVAADAATSTSGATEPLPKVNWELELEQLRQRARDLDQEARKQERMAAGLHAEWNSKRQRLHTYSQGLLRHSHDTLPTAALAATSPAAATTNGHSPVSASTSSSSVAVLTPPSESQPEVRLGGGEAARLVCDKCLQEVDPEAFKANVAQMEAHVAAAREEWSVAAEASDVREQAARAAAQAVTAAEQRQRDEFAQLRAAQQAEAQRLAAARQSQDQAAQAAVEEYRRRHQQLSHQLREMQQLEEGCGYAIALLDSALSSWPPEMTALTQALNNTSGTADALDAHEIQRRCQQARVSIQAANNAWAAARELAAKRSGTQAQVNPFNDAVARNRDELTYQRQQISEQLDAVAVTVARLAQLEEADRALGRGGVPSFVLEGVLGELQELSAAYLETLAEGMTLQLSSTTPVGGATTPRKTSRNTAAATLTTTSSTSDVASGREKDEIQKVVWVQRPDGVRVERSLLQLSGGERRRVALALALGFSQLVRRRGRLDCNLLVLDEVMQQLDGEGCNRVAALLRALELDTVLLVGQVHSFLTDNFDADDMDIVVKVGGASHLRTPHAP